MKTTETTVLTFKSNGEERTGRLLSKAGIVWKVEPSDELGSVCQVQKKLVLETWIDGDPEHDTWAELTAETPPLPGTLSTSLAGLLGATPPVPAAPKAKEKAPVDPDLVTLADLLTEYKLVGRIARRRLRKALGTVGTGSRWEWKKDSTDLAKVREILSPTPTPTPVADPVAEALDTLGMTQEDLDAGLASAGEQGAAAAAAE